MASSAAATLLGMSKDVPGSVATTVGVVGFAAWWILSSRGERYIGRRNYREKIEWAKLARGSVPVSDGSRSTSEANEDEDGFLVVAENRKGGGSNGDDDWDTCADASSSSGSGVADEEDLKGRVRRTVKESQSARKARLSSSGVTSGPSIGTLLPDQLSRAVLKGDRDAVVAALEEGGDAEMDINACDEYGNTLVVLATQAGSAPTVDYLLQRGADINAQNWRGQTALHFAYAFQYHELADFLLAHGASRELRNDYGLSPEEGLGGTKGSVGLVPLSPGGMRVAHPGKAYIEAPRTPQRGGAAGKDGEDDPMRARPGSAPPPFDLNSPGANSTPASPCKPPSQPGSAPTASSCVFGEKEKEKVRAKYSQGPGSQPGQGPWKGWKGAHSAQGISSPGIAHSLSWGPGHFSGDGKGDAKLVGSTSLFGDKKTTGGAAGDRDDDEIPCGKIEVPGMLDDDNLGDGDALAAPTHTLGGAPPTPATSTVSVP
eukprot:CAMPEP_0169442572 /NCGR_PEP_ID=MMETSP1042-20121227/8901_1 /TAXON_ID=464988 /ORGANISM="Hemiselmis andersenii, Strain CCMP1180" /LENGTH=486 /DNA_ID=CAMNT_0009553757 /DNA_START=23 /DNA_END=1479 /DNA_ORIENTATION=+